MEVCLWARSKHVHRLAYIKGAIWESPRRCFVFSYIITFLKQIRIFMPWNEVVMDRIFITLCFIHDVSTCQVCALSYETVIPGDVIYIRRYGISTLEELIYGYVCKICVAFFSLQGLEFWPLLYDWIHCVLISNIGLLNKLLNVTFYPNIRIFRITLKLVISI